jgi:ketosteroid isomerase-like protein
MTDRDEVSNLLNRYCLLVDDADVEAWTDLFAEDAEFKVLDKTMSRSEMVRFMQETQSFDSGKHINLNSVIEVDGDRATAITDYLYVHKDAGGDYSFATDPGPHFGRYHDVLAKVAGTWRFAVREVRVYDEELVVGIIDEKTAAFHAAQGG